MQKCQLYHEGKIRLLHKLTDIEFLNEEYDNVHAWCDRYKDYNVFPNKSAVENRFLKGEPLSCFCLDGICNEVHVACNRDKPEWRGDKCEVTFLSFCHQISQMYTHDTGMQFCHVMCNDEVSSVKKSSLNIVDYALMLPIQGEVFCSKVSLLGCILIGRCFCVITMLLTARRDLFPCIGLFLKMCCLSLNYFL